MLDETETEETIGFVVTFLSLVTAPPWLRLCTFCSTKAQRAAAE